MDTMRDDLEAAFGSDTPEGAQETVDETRQSAGEPSVKPDTETGGSFGGDSAESDPSKTAQELDASKEVKKPEEAAPETDPKPEDKATAQKPAEKAPASWKPAEREGWDKLPPHVKAAVNRREQEMQHNLQVTAQARNVAKSFHDMVMPYKPVFDAEGVSDPMQGIQSLLQVAAGLRMGSQQQKALEVAKIIQGYDVSIEALDSLLAGQQPQQENNQIEELINQRMAPVNQLLSQLNQSAEQEQQTQTMQASQSIAEFSNKAEFLAEVRNDMADLMDMAAQRGQRMTLDQAYAKACALNPEIAQVMEQRQQQQRIQQAAQSTAQKKNASSSIMGTKGGAGGQSGDMSLRSLIEEQWNER